MGIIAFIPLSIFGLLFFFVVDKSFQNIFGFFNVFSLSVLYLLFFLGFKDKVLSGFLFFFFGVLVDWYYKTFLGVSSLLSVIVLYVAAFALYKFPGNRWSFLGLHILISYFLFYIFNGYTAFVDIRNLIAALITSTIVLLWNMIREG